ncbi:unnamed protein product [Rotaria sp. Silwood1]|nr:unnamed protein product [Rotaria sp. Silwood1]
MNKDFWSRPRFCTSLVSTQSDQHCHLHIFFASTYGDICFQSNLLLSSSLPPFPESALSDIIIAGSIIVAAVRRPLDVIFGLIGGSEFLTTIVFGNN